MECDGIQVNFCKNPVCPNYGNPASGEKQPRGRQHEPRQDTYTLSSGGEKRSRLHCGRCDDRFPIKSNVAICEEVERMAGYLQTDPEPCCPNPLCDNSRLGMSTPKTYYLFGKTKFGSQRYR